MFCENLPGNSPIVAAIARLDRDGFTDELLKRLWQKYPTEAAAMPLPKIAGNGSQERKVQPLDAGSASPSSLTISNRPAVKTADEAVRRHGSEWATYRQLAAITGMTESALRAAAKRALDKGKLMKEHDIKPLTQTRSGTARLIIRIRGLWPHLSCARERSEK